MNKKLICGALTLAMAFNVSGVSFVFAEKDATVTKTAITLNNNKKDSAIHKEEKMKEKIEKLKDVNEKLKEKKDLMVEKVKELKEKVEVRKANYEKLHNLFERKIKLIEQKIKAAADDYKKIDVLNNQLTKAKEQLAKLEAGIKEDKKALKEKIKEEYTSEELEAINNAAEIMKRHGDLKVLPVESILAKGKKIKFDVPPVIKEGRVLVPIKALSNAYGFDVKWDADAKKITISKEGKTIELYVDSKEAYVNSEKVELDVPAKIYNSRTVIPLRFIIEKMGLNAKWDEETQTVDINEELSSTNSEEPEDIDEGINMIDEQIEEIINEDDDTKEVISEENDQMSE